MGIALHADGALTGVFAPKVLRNYFKHENYVFLYK